MVKSENKAKAIIHLDMDAFYAAVETLDNPALKGKPVIVGGTNKRGVVSSASYEARKFGIHSAQPVAKAMGLCPHGIYLPVRMGRYVEVSKQVFEIFYRFSPLVEPLSIDEGFLDVTGSARLFGTPVDIVKKIKRAVVEEIGLTVSAGVAPCKFVAKIASDLHKPDGLTVVPEGKVTEFLEPLSIERLWGVGKETQKALALLGVQTIGDLSRIPSDVLEMKFGKHGIHLHLLSQGIDNRVIETQREAKSIGREDTFPEDLIEMNTVNRELLSLATRVSRRLRRKEYEGRTVTLKVKYSDFEQVTRSITLSKATDDAKVIFHCCKELLEKTEAGRRPIRLLGISLSHIRARGEEKQLSLFQKEHLFQQSKKLNLALDKIYDKYGEDAILPGTILDKE
jgi:DNA polymerase-4